MSMKDLEKKFGREFLDAIIDWIAENLDPFDVYTEEYMEKWVKEMREITSHFSTLDKEYLIDWAMTNGYIKEEDCPDE